MPVSCPMAHARAGADLLHWHGPFVRAMGGRRGARVLGSQGLLRAGGLALCESRARRRVMKLAHSSVLTIRTGPCGFLGSRPAPMPGWVRATSPQAAPLAFPRVGW